MCDEKCFFLLYGVGSTVRDTAVHYRRGGLCSTAQLVPPGLRVAIRTLQTL